MLKYFLLGLAIILTAIFIFVRVKKGGVIALYTKALASVGFIAIAIFGAYESMLGLASSFILLGLIMGLLGDIVLDLKVVYKEDNDSHLNAGMLCFGVGHIFYFIALTILVSNTLYLTNKLLPILLVGALVGVLFTVGVVFLAKPMLKLDFGKFKIQTILYTFILSFMTAYSIGVTIFAKKVLLFAIGLLFILISDLVLSNQYFGGKQDDKFFTFLNHSIYYMGQIAIAMLLFFI